MKNKLQTKAYTHFGEISALLDAYDSDPCLLNMVMIDEWYQRNPDSPARFTTYVISWLSRNRKKIYEYYELKGIAEYGAMVRHNSGLF